MSWQSVGWCGLTAACEGTVDATTAVAGPGPLAHMTTSSLPLPLAFGIGWHMPTAVLMTAVERLKLASVDGRGVQLLIQNAHTHMLIDEGSLSIAPACLRTDWHHPAQCMCVQASHVLFPD